MLAGARTEHPVVVTVIVVVAAAAFVTVAVFVVIIIFVVVVFAVVVIDVCKALLLSGHILTDEKMCVLKLHHSAELASLTVLFTCLA